MNFTLPTTGKIASNERRLLLAEIEEKLSGYKLALIDSPQILEKQDLTDLTTLVKFYCASYTNLRSYDHPVQNYTSAGEILGRIDRLVRLEKRYFRWFFLLCKTELFMWFAPAGLLCLGSAVFLLLAILAKQLKGA